MVPHFNAIASSHTHTHTHSILEDICRVNEGDGIFSSTNSKDGSRYSKSHL